VWAVAAAAAVAGMFAMATPAAAHVTVNPREATQGGFARIDFRVPNERTDASTVRLEVHLPDDVAITSVSVMSVPGWSVQMQHRPLEESGQGSQGGHDDEVDEVVSAIIWTADSDGAALAPGQFGEFPVSLGPLPDLDALVFRALQHYSDGEVVRWIEPPAPDGSEPANPAPVLSLVAAGGAADGPGPGDGTAGAGDDGGASDEGGEAADRADPAGGDAGAGVWLGIAGLVAGLAGLALGGTAFIRTRRA
jgi:uncharacterized protein YcnI